MEQKDIYVLKKKAVDYVKREKFDKAIDIYYALLKATPHDTSLMLKIGNIHQTIGQENAAVKIYAKATEFYYERQMYQQGIAVCRLILNVDPLNIMAQQRLVDMYIKVYGGLPKKRGDTIIPPAYMVNEEDESVEEIDGKSDAVETAAENKRDSWQPVDIVFSTGEPELPDVQALSPEALSPEALLPEEVVPEAVVAIAEDDEDDDEEEAEFTQPGILSRKDLPEIPLFASLNEVSLKQILENAPTVQVQKNEFILREGETGDSFYILLSGSVQVLKGDLMKPMARLSAGACFGEMALFGLRARRASVLAVEPTELLEIDRDKIRQLQNRFPEIRMTLRKYVRERLLDNLMVSCTLFSPFSDEDHEALKKRFVPKEFIKLETVFKRGDRVNELFLIVDGRAEVLLDFPRQRRQLIRTMGIGEIFGEIPLLTNSDSKVTVRAKERLSTLCLPKEYFRQLIMRHPKILSLVSELVDAAGPDQGIKSWI